MTIKLVARDRKSSIRLDGDPCLIAKISGDLSTSQSKDFQQALLNPLETSSDISRWLRASGLRGSPSTVALHRRGDCGCPRILKKSSK